MIIFASVAVAHFGKAMQPSLSVRQLPARSLTSLAGAKRRTTGNGKKQYCFHFST